MSNIKELTEAVKEDSLYIVSVKFDSPVPCGIDHEYYFVGIATSYEKGEEMGLKFVSTYKYKRRYSIKIVHYYVENTNEICGHEFIGKTYYME